MFFKLINLQIINGIWQFYNGISDVETIKRWLKGLNDGAKKAHKHVLQFLASTWWSSST